jgi:hypothetical protein
MELRPSSHELIRGARAAKLRSYRVPLLPEFHDHLARHASVYEVFDRKNSVGYTLIVKEQHGDHAHATVLELYLNPSYEDRYEDALAVVKEVLQPNAYLIRSDECLIQTALLSRGLQMEITLAVLVARAVRAPGEGRGLRLTPLDHPDLKAAWDILAHVRGADNVPPLAELQHEVARERWWVVRLQDQPVGLVNHERSPGGMYEVIDVLAPYRVVEEKLWALLEAGRRVEKEGFAPAAVIDVRDTAKLDLFRRADYFTAAAYLVFYDPVAGRPSVGAISRDELWGLLQGGEDLHLIDVLGERHWRQEHIPGSEWIDFRSLSREARARYEKDEPIVVYCNDYT